MDILDFLTPNSVNFQEAVWKLPTNAVGSAVDFLSDDAQIENYDFAVICVNEFRGQGIENSEIDFEPLKFEFYKLFSGNWKSSIIDLGLITAGEKTTDTYYVLKQLTHVLLNKKVIPIILGGSQDLCYCQYRAYDGIKYMINFANLDFKFDLGDSNKKMNHESYLSHMIVDQPYNLFNFSNLGYQTYLNSQEEIGLIDKMFFEAYRLGEVISDVRKAEPVLRDADMVTIDVRSIESRYLGSQNIYANGFNSREICALARYAGISDKVSSFGLYELQYLNFEDSKYLLSQVLWYFVEGFQYRLNEKANVNNPNFIKYQVPIENEILVFYESQLSGRWWIEIPSNSKDSNNKLKQHTLLPCDKENYLLACDQELPERWIKAKQKNEI
jgi:hypothetical protein